MPHKLKIKNRFSNNANKDEEMPRSSGSGNDSKRENLNGSKEESKCVSHRKLLDDEISKGDIKMRAALDSYLSVSESEGEN